MKKITLYFISFFVLSLATVSCGKDKKEIQKNQKGIASRKRHKTASFNYKLKKPVNGVLKGVVELGASGFNSFIINIDNDKNWEIKRKEFGNSLMLEGLTTAKEVNKKLEAYIQEIIEFGVLPKNIHFVMSSGAKKSKISDSVIKELKSIGYVVNVVTPEQEGILALKSVMPEMFKPISFVVDLGSGNTKIAYYDKQEEGIISKETYGAKYFQKNIDDKKVYDDIRKIAKNIPKGKQSLCFIIGGVPYHMAKHKRKNKERFTMLDISLESYKKLIEKKGKKIESGFNIFKAIADETNSKRFVFDWNANFTIGFLLDLPKKEL